MIKACEVVMLEGFHVGNSRSDGLLVSHLLSADDTLIFYKPYENDLGYLRYILLVSEAMSRL